MLYTRRSAIGLLAAGAVDVATARFAAAQQEDLAKLAAAARREGQVIVWGESGEKSRRFWKDAFEKQFPGIEVSLFQAGTSSQRDTRFLREYQSHVAKVDVLISGSSGMIGRLRPAKAIQPLRPLLLPSVLDGKNWLNGAPVWVDDDKKFVMIADLPASPPAITNSKVAQGSIKNWTDLLSPQYDGKIVALDPRQSGLSLAFSLFMYTSSDLGPSYVEKFYKGGRIVFTPDQREITDWVDSGRMLIGFAVRETQIDSLLKVGSKINILPALIAGGKPQGLLVGSDSAVSIPNLHPLPHPNAARLYVNWIYSKQGQQAMVDVESLFSTRTDVDESSLPARIKQKPGVKYTNANSERFVAPQTVKNLRSLVTKAIGER